LFCKRDVDAFDEESCSYILFDKMHSAKRYAFCKQNAKMRTAIELTSFSLFFYKKPKIIQHLHFALQNVSAEVIIYLVYFLQKR
jgi:hypothetical protein